MASYVTDPAIVRAQAKAIVTRRVMGHSVNDIAKEMQMSPDTVKRRIDWAKRHGLVEDALDTVLNQLVPEALKTYLLAIQNGDVDAARDVMYGTGILQKNPKTGQAPIEKVEMTIETYRQQRQKDSDQTSLPAAKTAGSNALPVIDARIERAPFKFDLAALTQEVGEDDN